MSAPLQRSDLQPAFLMHRRPYRETSALLETFTRDHGRIALVARGARRPRSALRGALQPFVPLLIGWFARGELGTLRNVEVPVAVRALEGRALISGLYVNELLLRLTHRNDPHPELFAAYASVLDALRAQPDEQTALRVFEKRTLEAVGYGLLLERDADSGSPVEASRRYAYRADQGPVRGTPRDGGFVDVSGATLLALAAESALDPTAQREAKRLMRFVIGAHLGGRPLASRALFRGAGG